MLTYVSYCNALFCFCNIRSVCIFYVFVSNNTILIVKIRRKPNTYNNWLYTFPTKDSDNRIKNKELQNVSTYEQRIQWWLPYPDTFFQGRYFRINEFSGLLIRPLVRTWKSVSTLRVRISEISGVSEPGLTNHHCISLVHHMIKHWKFIG